MRTGIIAVAVMLTFSAMAKDKSVVPENSLNTISSLDQVAQITRSTQEQFWMLIPPLEDFLYIHPDSRVYAVSWEGAGWPDLLKKQMYAEMRTVNASMYPVYRLTVEESRSGELIFYNSYGTEVWRSPAPKNYDPYAFAKEHFSVNAIAELTEQQLQYGRSSNVGMELILLPESFASSYEQDAALEAQATMLAAPVMRSLPAVVTNLQLSIERTANGTVEIELGWPTNFTNRLEIYSATDLVEGNWQFALTNIATLGSSTHVWEDTNTNHTHCYYAAGNADIDSDGDSIPDAREKFIFKTHPGLADTDGDFIDDGDEISNGTNPLQADSNGDGLHDGIEDALAVSELANGSGGVLVVVPETGWYHAIDPVHNLIYLGGE